ncbi:putative cytochrome P450, chromophore lyase CpcT/CpeT, cytochrome P450 superfamily [Helianthus annuus]|nr:putative cytochrome P450, chromophore lyase CpcT/CpeT, cytochrome P450 superfamily [Helianthus annuus]
MVDGSKVLYFEQAFWRTPHKPFRQRFCKVKPCPKEMKCDVEMTCNPTDQAIYVFILLTGTDTTTATLTWALALLVNHPVVLKIAQQELENHDGRDRKVEESDMNNLVYLQAIIKETMRLYRAAPLSVPHEST